MSINEYYNNHKIGFVLGIFTLIIMILTLGLLFFPTIFYDNFIWKYFWGPIVSDVSGYPVSYNGVLSEEKYTFISEMIYGLLIIIVLYGCYKLLKRWNVNVNWRFCLALLPYIVVGSVTRVLEDSRLFNEPIVYWFVSPLIYIQILLWVITFFMCGYYLQKHFKNKYLTINSVLFIGGIILLSPFLFYIIQWFLGNQWNTSYGIRFDIFFIIAGLILLIITVVYFISHFFKNNENIKIYSKPLNLAMIGGHMIDGITSYVSIYDPLQMGLPKYIEKHPASDILMEIWPPLFPLIKFLLIVIVIYIFDVIYKKEFEEHHRLINLLKIGIFILGFAPGLRDLLRVMMGV